MAERKNPSRKNEMEQFDSPVEMLEDDHAKVEALFEKFEAMRDGQRKAKQEIVKEVFAELEIHAQLEEEIFYPAIKALGEKEGSKLVAESLEEHQVVKTLMEDMRALDPSDEQYEAKFIVLIENVRHHIEEEEGEMFPLAEDELGAEMDGLLDQMMKRKQVLQAS